MASAPLQLPNEMSDLSNAATPQFSKVSIVTPEEAGATVAELAAGLLGAEGRLIATRGGAWLNGRRAAPDDPAPAGARLELRRPPGGVYVEAMVGAESIVYEDEWLIVLRKAAGWYVGPTPWDVQGSALAGLGRYLDARDGAAPALHLAHQLDRDTSGLLLVSKSPLANGPLQAAFAARQVGKSYLALCAGVPPSSGTIHTGHGRAAGGRWRIYPLEEVGSALPGGGGRIKEALTDYSVERALDDAALVRAALRTGRTHQIRLHMAAIGHPLLGDIRYGGPARYGDLELPGHMLHAAALRLNHPITGAPLTFEEPPPALFAQICG